MLPSAWPGSTLSPTTDPCGADFASHGGGGGVGHGMTLASVRRLELVGRPLWRRL